jgi:hypothetical protein
MSGFSEDDVRRAAEIREWLMKQITDKQEELERLRDTLTVVDSILKQGSFRAAATLAPEPKLAPAKHAMAMSPLPPAKQSSFDPGRDVRQLKRAKDDFLLANAEVTANAIVITPAVSLNSNTPPFKSFFLNRILDGMKAKDAEKGLSDALSYSVDESNGQIKLITISNYRDKERLGEIFNTSTWVFTRMLEKSA